MSCRHPPAVGGRRRRLSCPAARAAPWEHCPVGTELLISSASSVAGELVVTDGCQLGELNPSLVGGQRLTRAEVGSVQVWKWENLDVICLKVIVISWRRGLSVVEMWLAEGGR